jgi:hypothetical protein
MIVKRAETGASGRWRSVGAGPSSSSLRRVRLCGRLLLSDAAPACGRCPRSRRSGGEGGHPTGPRTGSTGSCLRSPRGGASSDNVDATGRRWLRTRRAARATSRHGWIRLRFCNPPAIAAFSRKRLHSNDLTNGAEVDRGIAPAPPALGPARSAGSKRERAAGAGNAVAPAMRSGDDALRPMSAYNIGGL